MKPRHLPADDLEGARLAPTSASVRKLLERVLVTDSDLDAFALDHFEAAHDLFTNGMDRVAKRNHLLKRGTPAGVLAALRSAHPEAVAAHEALLQWDPAVGPTALELPHAMASGWPPSSGVRCLLASVPEDERIAHGLKKHLALMERQGLLSILHLDGDDLRTISPRDVEARVTEAELILLLVSADFLASAELHASVVEPALRRSGLGATVVPILARLSSFSTSTLGKLRPLPSNGEPIATFRSSDEAFLDVAQAVHGIVRARTGARSATTR
jgi:hypothetical protein